MNAIEFLEKEYGDVGSVDTETFPFPSLVLDRASYGAYTGTLVEVSNHHAFLKEHGDSKWVHDVRRGEWRSVLLHPNALRDESIRETVNALACYPLLDDSHYYRVVEESYQENFREYAADEIVCFLTRTLSNEGKTLCSDYLWGSGGESPEVIQEWFESLDPDKCKYVDEEASSGVWIPWEGFLNKATRSDVARLIRSLRGIE